MDNHDDSAFVDIFLPTYEESQNAMHSTNYSRIDSSLLVLPSTNHTNRYILPPLYSNIFPHQPAENVENPNDLINTIILENPPSPNRIITSSPVTQNTDEDDSLQDYIFSAYFYLELKRVQYPLYSISMFYGIIGSLILFADISYAFYAVSTVFLLLLNIFYIILLELLFRRYDDLVEEMRKDRIEYITTLIFSLAPLFLWLTKKWHTL